MAIPYGRHGGSDYFNSSFSFWSWERVRLSRAVRIACSMLLSNSVGISPLLQSFAANVIPALAASSWMALIPRMVNKAVDSVEPSNSLTHSSALFILFLSPFPQCVGSVDIIILPHQMRLRRIQSRSFASFDTHTATSAILRGLGRLF